MGKKVFVRYSLLAVPIVLALALMALPVFPALAANLHVQVSDVGGANILSNSNTTQKVAVSTDGIIYIVYHGQDGVRVARSLDGGATYKPSVQITATDAEVEVAVDRNGIVYLAGSDGMNVYISRSTDQGVTFSTPAVAFASTNRTVHIATDPPYVYLLPQSADKLWVNNANGVGAFTSAATPYGGMAFSGLGVDPSSKQVIAIGDNPNQLYAVSSNFGASFGPTINAGTQIFYSSYAWSFSSLGRFIFTSGAGTAAFRIDLDAAAPNGTALTFGANTSPSGRSLAALRCNVIDGYANGAGVEIRVSQDLGATFATPKIVAATGANLSVAINPTNLDVVVAYDAGGQVYASTYNGLLNSTCGAPAPSPTPTAVPVAVSTATPVIAPGTGFAPNRVTVLQAQTVSYADLGDLWLEIPALGVQIPIVGVPQSADGKWDVSWLGNDAGWLNGSAFPTHAGNSVITGHVTNAAGNPGPFAGLNRLWYGSQIIVHAWGGQYIYEVRSVMQVAPGNTAAMMRHQDLPWLTLVTCRGYDEASNTYKYRVLVKAVLVEAK